MRSSPAPTCSTVDGEPAVTVVTNALNIANELAVRRNVKIVLTGGVARPQSFELFGPLAERVLSDVHIDMTFLGVEGIDARGRAPSPPTRARRASTGCWPRGRRRSSWCTDSTKLGQPHVRAHLADPIEVATLVTDTDATSESLRRFEDAGVKVVQV